MKRFATALALMGALSTPIFAGNMPTDGRTETPPSTTTSSTSPGETHTPPGETQSPPEATQEPSLLETIILTIITWR